MTQQKRKPADKIYLVFYITVGILCVSLLGIRYILHPVTVVGSSMDPTYKDGQIVSTSVFHPDTDTLSVGDIVIFDTAKYGKTLIKRVVALPGDTIQIKDGMIYRNGAAVDDGYPLMEYAGLAEQEITLEEGTVFCLGDNRNNSSDSRMIGPVGYTDITGVVKDIIFGWWL